MSEGTAAGSAGAQATVQTVTAKVALDQLGVTTMHEHMLVRMPQFVRPRNPSQRDLPDLKVSLGTLGRIKRDPLSNHDNLVLDELEMAISEVSRFPAAGGQTIVDVTNDGFGRDPAALQTIAKELGINIVMGCGFYIDAAHPADMDKRTVEGCAEEIVRDLTVGVRETGVRAGVIGEIGCSNEITANERKALRAAALAQSETGAPIWVHPPIPFEQNALVALDILEETGADLRQVLICHMDHTLHFRDYHKAVAERGCMLEFDRFGNEWYYDSRNAWHEPRDELRVEAIRWLVSQGFENQIVVGQDICYKINWTKYGGAGYGHLLTNIIPMFERMGIDEATVTKLLVANPRRFLSGQVQE